MIYLDEQATTPLAPEALAAMLPWLGGPQTQGFANPHSPHKSGRAAAAAVAVARDQVAGLFPPGGTVVFTSGATEAINLAMLGLNPRRLAVSAIEHAAVLDTAAFMARGGAEVATLPVSPAGLVASDALIAPKSARSSRSMRLPRAPMPPGRWCCATRCRALAGWPRRAMRT